MNLWRETLVTMRGVTQSGIFLALMVLGFLSNEAAAQYSGGKGVPEDPYKIASAQDLIDLGREPNDYDKHFVLTAHIDLDPGLAEGRAFNRAVIARDPNSAYGFDGTPFVGTFNGNSFKIQNLTLSDGGDYLGLFGYLDPNAVVLNLVLENVAITATGDHVGALAGFSGAGHISGCSSTGTVTGFSRVGGLLGMSESGNVSNCTSAATVVGNSYVGGLIGKSEYGRLLDSTSHAAVTGQSRTGGLIGGLQHGRLLDCTSHATVLGQRYTGGLVGQLFTAHVSNSHNTGQINGSDVTGGLTGDIWNTHVFGCTNQADVYGEEQVGGLVGQSLSNTQLFYCTNTGAVFGEDEVGGLVGWNGAQVSHCYSQARVFGEEDVGGLVGKNSGPLFRCYSTGAVTGTSDQAMPGQTTIGGLVGGRDRGNSSDTVSCFWDTETSGQSSSNGGKGLSTAQMQDLNTYLNAGWDFVGESDNGLCEFWLITENAAPQLSLFAGYTPIEPEGSGTLESPYLIENAQTLATLWYRYFAAYRLTEDVDLAGLSWTAAVVPWFAGTFDGGRHTIDHLQVKGQSGLGLFGLLAQEAQVKDLGLENVSVQGTGSNTGALAGTNQGQVLRCTSTGDVQGAGGLVGRNEGLLSLCTSSVTVKGGYGVGGLAGANSGQCRDCYSTGSVTGTSLVGGLLGSNTGTVFKCYSTGLVTAAFDAGGLVAQNMSSISMSFWDTSTSGQVSSPGGVGLSTPQMMDPQWVGLNGLAEDPNWVLDPFADTPRLRWQDTAGALIPAFQVDWFSGQGTEESPYEIATLSELIELTRAGALWDRHFVLTADLDMGQSPWLHSVFPWFGGTFNGGDFDVMNLKIEGFDTVGFFAYVAPGAVIKNIHLKDAHITGMYDCVGALIGKNHGTRVSGCSSSGTVLGRHQVGGLIGAAGTGEVLDCHNRASVQGLDKIGGLIGNLEQGSLRHCFSMGTVKGDQDVGGLVGYNDKGQLSQCSSRSTVTTRPDTHERTGDHFGGLLGSNRGIVSQCLSHGTVSANESVGGLIGENGSRGAVSDSYSTANVQGQRNLGGLVGENASYKTEITHCYSIGSVTGQTEAGGLVGKNLASSDSVIQCFWDMETSGQAQSAGGAGLSTHGMNDLQMYLEAGWDFLDESVNGPKDIWRMDPDLPVLIWEPQFEAFAVFNLDEDPNWVSRGPWQFGQPTGQGAVEHGYPDPNQGYTGDNVYGVNLYGDYNPAEPGPFYLTTQALDCSAYSQVHLQFARWLNTDQADFVRVFVDISNDGATWQPIWEYADTEAELTDNTWQRLFYDITDHAAGHSTVFISWGYEILRTDAWPSSGWNIDDVRLLGVASGDQ